MQAYWHFRVINQVLANVLVVDLILFTDAQVLNHRSTGDLRHLAELIVVVIVSWADVWLARSQSCLHLDI